MPSKRYAATLPQNLPGRRQEQRSHERDGPEELASYLTSFDGRIRSSSLTVPYCGAISRNHQIILPSVRRPEINVARFGHRNSVTPVSMPQCQTESVMLSAVKKFGNSARVIIPKPLLSEIGAQAGDSVELKVEAGRIVIERISSQPRSGWAEDAKRLAAAGDDELIWPEIANEDDKTLTW
jgi:antitoxin MazE